jgi:hypothetical protein
VVRRAVEAGLVSGDHFSADGTLIQSYASLKSLRPIDPDFCSVLRVAPPCKMSGHEVCDGYTRAGVEATGGWAEAGGGARHARPRI